MQYTLAYDEGHGGKGQQRGRQQQQGQQQRGRRLQWENLIGNRKNHSLQ